MMLRALLCDDEPLALARLADMLQRLPGIAIAAEVNSGDAAVRAIVDDRPDVAFMDIEMPSLDGFDVVEQLSRIEDVEPPLIVFVTAYPQFAAHAFETGAIDFLTKPVRLSRLETTIERIREAIEDRSARERLHDIMSQLDGLRRERHSHATRTNYLWISQRGEMVRVDLDRVAWVQAEGEYVRLHLDGAVSYLHREPITAMAIRLDSDRYVRVHRSYIIDRDRVVAIRRRPAGGYKLLLEDDLEIPVGRNFRAEARAIVDATGQDED